MGWNMKVQDILLYVALGVSVASVVLSIMGEVATDDVVQLLAIGLACVSLSLISSKKKD